MNTLESFFESYAQALVSFNAGEISMHYHTPLAVYSDKGVQTVNEDAEVLTFWKDAVKPYEALKITNAVPTILSSEDLSSKVSICKVQWNSFDVDKKQVSEETNFYILMKVAEKFRISGLVIMTII